MLDIKGKRIQVGDTVRSQQPSGGVLPTGRPQVGVVELGFDAFGKETLLIRFDEFRLIDLKNKVNSII